MAHGEVEVPDPPMETLNVVLSEASTSTSGETTNRSRLEPTPTNETWVHASMTHPQVAPPQHLGTSTTPQLTRSHRRRCRQHRS